MQVQIVLTVAVLRVVDIVPILLKSMVTDITLLTYTDNCGRKCKVTLIRLCLYFLVLIISDIGVKGGATD